MRFLMPMAERDAEGLVDAWRDVPADDPGVAHAAEQLARVRAIQRRIGWRNAFKEALAQGEAVTITSRTTAEDLKPRTRHNGT